MTADYPIFMAVAETCGHDRRGNEIEEDDIKDIAIEFKKWEKVPLDRVVRPRRLNFYSIIAIILIKE